VNFLVPQRLEALVASRFLRLPRFRHAPKTDIAPCDHNKNIISTKELAMFFHKKLIVQTHHL
jgi:hypothetical protein